MYIPQQLSYQTMLSNVIKTNEAINNLIQYYTYQIPLYQPIDYKSIYMKPDSFFSEPKNSMNETSVSSSSEGNKTLFMVRKMSDVSTSSDGKNINIYYFTYKDCEKQYKSRENLFFHIQNVHLKKKPYSCKLCKNAFSHRNGLNYHLKDFHHIKIEKKCKKKKIVQ